MTLNHKTLTGQILDASFEVSNELGVGFVESVYEQSLLIALKGKGLNAERQVPIKVFFRGELVGTFQADMVVEGEVILELKAAKTLLPEHHAQVLNYLKATGKPVAMLLNFGQPRLEWRRFDNRFEKSFANRDEGDEGDKR